MHVLCSVAFYTCIYSRCFTQTKLLAVVNHSVSMHKLFVYVCNVQELQEVLTRHKRENEEWVEKMRQEFDAQRKEIADQKVAWPIKSRCACLPIGT